jgi:hypothetical protein
MQEAANQPEAEDIRQGVWSKIGKRRPNAVARLLRTRRDPGRKCLVNQEQPNATPFQAAYCLMLGSGKLG